MIKAGSFTMQIFYIYSKSPWFLHLHQIITLNSPWISKFSFLPFGNIFYKTYTYVILPRLTQTLKDSKSAHFLYIYLNYKKAIEEQFSIIFMGLSITSDKYISSSIYICRGEIYKHITIALRDLI